MRLGHHLIVVLTLLIPLQGESQERRLFTSPIALIEQSSKHLLFELPDYEPVLSQWPGDGDKKSSIRIAGFGVVTEGGLPELPETGVFVALPPNHSVEVSILGSETELLTEIDLRLSYTPNTDSPQSGGPRTMAATGLHSGFWPPSIVEVADTLYLRGERIVRVRVRPVQFDASTRELRVHKKLRFRVGYQRTLVPSSNHGSSVGLNHVERIFDSFVARPAGLVLNDKLALQPQHLPSGWHSSNQDYFKVLVEQNGIYRITYQELIAAGVPVSQIVSSEVKLYLRGAEVPIWISGPSTAMIGLDNHIIFYGEKNLDASGTADLYSDAQIYWLTYGPGPGLRYFFVDTISTPQRRDSVYFKVEHMEKDSIFHRSNRTTIQENDEGWIWQYLFPNDRFTHEFDVTGLAAAARPCSLTVRLHGTTRDPASPDHHVQFTLNGEDLGEAYFDERTEVVWRTEFASSFVRHGKNRLEIHLVPDTGAEVNQVYVDWVKVSYPRLLGATEGQLSFEISDIPGQVTSYEVAGFPEKDSILVIAPGTGRAWQPTTVRNTTIILTSAGFDDGNYASCSVDFKEYSLNRRGHNVVVLAPGTNRVESRNFDTYAARSESDALAAYINGLRTGSVIMIAIADDGSQSMTDSGRQALESIGSTKTGNVEFRDSWLLLTRKGGSVADVVERHSPSGSGIAQIRHPLSAEQAIGWSATFVDTTTTKSQYHTASASGYKRIASIRRDLPSELKSPDQQADYIVIAHREFWGQAQRLALYRQQQDGFRSMVVEVEDIYDEFNYGVISPQAIKEFLSTAYHSWQTPKPAYVLLMGDSSWDPKKLRADSKAFDFIPSYGALVSDNWYVSLDGEDDVLPDMFIGRIPARTASEADAVINKIIAYEALDFDFWNKHYVFFNGGINETEQGIFVGQANALIESYISTEPFLGMATQFNKTTDEAITASFRTRAATTINRGALWVNFLGHGGNSVWDIDIGQPEDWNNDEIFPFVTGMSCHAARFANPVINSLAEDFVLNPKGAIAYWGSAGFGYIVQDFLLLDGLIPAITQDSLRRIGPLTTAAKLSLAERLGAEGNSRNVIEQYVLIGDPALSLAVARKPEISVRSEEIDVAPEIVLTSTPSFDVSSRLRNFGPALNDTFSVALRLLTSDRNEVRNAFFERRLTSSLDSVEVSWPAPELAGDYLVEVEIDPVGALVEETVDNNVAQRELRIFASDLSLIKPARFSVVQDTVELIVENSRIGNSGFTYFFEVDTAATFNSPTLQQSRSVTEGTPVTRWRPEHLQDDVYYWRARSFDGRDFGPWDRASFTIGGNVGNNWSQSQGAQFASNSLSNLDVSSQGLTLARNSFHVRAESAGFNDGNTSLLSVNGHVVGKNRRGHNIAVLDNRTLQVISTGSFDTYVSQDSANAMADYLDALPDSSIVLVAVKDEGSRSMTERAYLSLESLGSQQARLVSFRDSWAMMGKKGGRAADVIEVLRTSSDGRAAIADTLQRFSEVGTATSPEIGPTLRWRRATFSTVRSKPQEELELFVLGQSAETGLLDTLTSATADAAAIDLDEINATSFPKIVLHATLSSSDGRSTPLLDSWAVQFEPTPDIVVGRGSLEIEQDTVLVGQQFNLNIAVGNFGLSDTDSFAIHIKGATVDGTNEDLFDLRTMGLGLDEVASHSVEASIETLLGEVELSLIVDASNDNPEIDETNNSTTTTIWVVRDTVSPDIRITFDGREVAEDDFVAANPSVVVELRDQGAAAVADTARLVLLLDERKVAYGSSPGKAQFLPQQNPDDKDLQALALFQPQLSEGSHQIEVIARDAADNLQYFQTEFVVSDRFVIANAMNYPNPFSSTTNFTYVLTQAAEQVRIKIYTVAGRLIHELEAPPGQVGYNQLQWDGRDQIGDRLANGVYLYKIIARRGEGQAEVVEKLVVMR